MSAPGSGAGSGSNSTPSNGPHNQPSLPSLPLHLQSDTQLTAHVASRFHAGLPNAKLSSHALICLNTHQSSSKGPDGTKEGSNMAAAEDLADRAWLRLGHRSENQAIVFLGESGAGKTTIRNHVINRLLQKTGSTLSSKLFLACFVFDALTTTKTNTTNTASKAGLFYELQYDTSASTTPTLLGGKLLDHRLERSRITDVPNGERNFHILYYLLAGTSDAERDHLGLGDESSAAAKRWKYLGHPTQLKVGVNDLEGFQHWKNAMRKLEFPKNDIAEICQVLACILHIGQLDFETTTSSAATADDSGGFSHEGGKLVTAVRNKDALRMVAAFLGISASDLQSTLGYKTRIISKERVTVMLDPLGAHDHANELARTLYSLLVAWIIETINERVCASEETIVNTVSVVDFPGFSSASSTGSYLDQLLNNAATEAIYNLALLNFFDRKADLLETEEVNVPSTSYFDNSDAVKGLLKHGNGLLSILDDQTKRNRSDVQFLESLRKRFEGKNTSIDVSSATAKLPGSNFHTENLAASFTIKHFAGEVEYQVRGLVEENGEVISGDLLNMINSSKSDFISRIFRSEALQTVVHPQERTTIMQATVSSKPMRKPSVVHKSGPRTRGWRRQHEIAEEPAVDPRDAKRGAAKSGIEQGASGQFLYSLENVQRAIQQSGTNSYFVFCLKPNDRRVVNQFDSKCVRSQMQTFGIAEISQRLRSADFSLFIPFGEFLGMADSDTLLMGSERERAEAVIEEKRWASNEVHVGSTGVFLSERCWLEIAQLSTSLTFSGHALSDFDGGEGLGPGENALFGASKERLLSGGNTPLIYGEKGKNGYFVAEDARSDAGISAFGTGDMFKNLDTVEQMAERGNEKSMEEVEEFKDSPGRRRWIFMTYFLTWFIPDLFIQKLGRMPRKDIRMAWREKVAINFMIWLSCLIAAFFIVVFPMLICPKQNVFSAAELTIHNGKKGKDAYASIRGWVFDLSDIAEVHYPSILDKKYLLNYAGMDVSGLFPVQVSALCDGTDGPISPYVVLDYKDVNVSGTPNLIGLTSIDLNAHYHDFRYFTNDSRPDWYYEQMYEMKHKFFKGHIGYTAKYVHMLSTKAQNIAILNNKVYDMTKYINGGRKLMAPAGEDIPTDGSLLNFMDTDLLSLFQTQAGNDLTKYWNSLTLSPDVKARMERCLDNLFFVGNVDTRNSTKCKFAEYLILGVSVILVSVIGFKFLAALQFGGRNLPEDLDKFVMCQIPAYTEDEDSLRRAIDSAARMRYDDKRKLLVVVCDGMIIGQGNDRPTPRIVLDILGVSESVDPEPLSFESLGEGLKQHNMGKVYSGLYEVQGHIVPFLVVVKVGKPSEASRPGNRGKRDSQMVIMRFLNRVHYNLPMSPMELEMYHQIRNIIGVNPTFYEFMLQIDADTVVAPDSASRMVSSLISDTSIIAVCGETALTNAKDSFVTMIQVYEYFISHNLSKAFESLFGSVTCLPGCFSMYRLRAADTGKPLFISREVVEAYATIRVDTLHMKNLLHLGEDRFLTTLLLKFHSKYKTKYIPTAHAWTIAPDSWQVFLSQRRRWINSTVHNLIELIPMAQLCGFCCFSMRFVVFIDLISTVVQPVTLAYIVYLVVLVVRDPTLVPVSAFILLGAIYGLQAIIFVVRRKWEMLGWMILYILAIPVFSFGLPLYAFWHMDDFAWGNTRVVAGEKGQKIVISDEGKFDPASIPRKKWEEYQAELWETQTSRDDARSEVSGFSYATKAPPAPQSEFGYSSRPGSIAGFVPPASVHGFNGPPASVHGFNGPPASVHGFNAPASVHGFNAPASALGFNPPGSVHGGLDRGMSRMSAFQPPESVYDASQFSPDDMVGLPSDDVILAEIRDILRTADLMTVTKKSVKQELERRFDVPLEAKRPFIHTATEALLSGQL